MNKKQLFIRAVIPLIILACAILAGTWLITNPEKARKGKRAMESLAPLVQTTQIQPGDFSMPIEALGQVVPTNKTTLKPQISGEILSIAPEFVPGGHLKKGEAAVTINPVDYELAVKRHEAALEQAEANYQLELGRQSIAREELAILERTTGRKPDNASLALRKPQLAQAKAEVEKAKADLAVALLDLERTSISIPFDSLITAREATTGDKVQPADNLATIVSTEEYWVEISMPVSDLKWLKIPMPGQGGTGSKARIVMQDGRGERDGVLFKIVGTVNPQSRFADLIVSVPDPLLLKEPKKDMQPLILDDYVRVIFEGKTIENSYRIPLSWLHSDNTIWIYDNDKLLIKPVTVIYEDREYAYITEGLTPGEKIITSDISVPVEGMKIRKRQAAENRPQQQIDQKEGN